MSHHINNTMAGLVALGGVVGFVKGRSLPSLVGGLVFAGAYGASGYLISQNEAYQGFLLGTGASAVLGGVMGRRFLKTRKVMPPGVLTALAAVAGAYNAYKLYEWS
eukprot:Colp12_sorted_trinity150504_noHs@31779